MDNKVKLRLMGLSYTPMQNEAFVMLLEAEGSDKRIPVIIGPTEAQAIAMVIEHLNPPRPMTHDLFATMTHAFGVELQQVFIYAFEDGIFSAEMTFADETRQITLDARTSDAVAVAIRCGAPIYTTPEILEETGVEFTVADETPLDDNADAETQPNTSDPKNYDSMAVAELEDELQKAIDNDDFELAAVIRRIIDAQQ